jgi:hypothetical protein
MGKQQFLLDLIDFIVDHSTELAIAEVHVLE